MKIAFTSCMDAERVPVQPVWDAIQKIEPDALMLLGDNIYMDWGLAALAKTPRWRKRWNETRVATGAREEMLDAFSEEMHRRYKLQWEVAAFKRLINWLVLEQERANKLYVIRDEHDMAWNNARGGGDSQDPKWVPADVAAASTRLFEQFRSVLSAPGEWATSYPVVGAQLALAPAPSPQLGPFTVLLQDQRSHRSVRFVLPGNKTEPNPQRRLLSDAAKQDMLDKVSALAPTRPLLIAGSSPLKHDYGFSEQGWWSSTTPYPEYQELIDAAKTSQRAVLYLGGDIHRLAYGGPVESGSSVVQMLASGAAVGQLLFKTFPASFAWLDVADGKVVIHGVSADKSTQYPDLVLSGDKWKGSPPAGEAPGELVLNELSPMAVLTVRAREARSEQEGRLTVDPQELDSVYGDTLSGYGGVPLGAEAVTVTQTPGSTRISLERNNQVQSLIEAAFERARTNQRSAVVFFIHGFNKSFSESLNQACTLRARFKAEPVLFSWPSGEDGGWLKSLLEAGDAVARCTQQLEALRVALQTFGRVATAYKNDVPATLVARSMGAFALQTAINYSRQSRQLPEELASVKRVLLSAPAVKVGAHTKWLELLGEKVVVTINRSDHSLAHGELLGRNVPSGQDRTAKVTYLDWQAVGDLHDYLLTSIGDAGDSLNQKLVTGALFVDADLKAAKVARC